MAEGNGVSEVEAPSEDTGALARLLGTFRERHDLTQTDLAAIVGVSAASVRNWETGRELPSKKSLRAIKAGMQTIDGDLADRVDEAALEVRKRRAAKPTIPSNLFQRVEELDPDQSYRGVRIAMGMDEEVVTFSGIEVRTWDGLTVNARRRAEALNEIISALKAVVEDPDRKGSNDNWRVVVRVQVEDDDDIPF